MGTDKSLLVYNGKPQREYIFECLEECCAKVFTSCRKDQYVPLHLNPLPDGFDFSGPLNGILSAFSFKPDASWLVVAVDMPFVTSAVLQLLISNRDKHKLATCFFNPETQQPEPLLTVWEDKAYSYLMKFAENGSISPRDFLKSHPVKMIQPPDEKILRNVNYPQ